MQPCCCSLLPPYRLLVSLVVQLVQELKSFLPLNWVFLGDTGSPPGVGVPPEGSTAGPKCPHVISFYEAYTDTYSDSVSMVPEYMNCGTLAVSRWGPRRSRRHTPAAGTLWSLRTIIIRSTGSVPLATFHRSPETRCVSSSRI